MSALASRLRAGARRPLRVALLLVLALLVAALGAGVGPTAWLPTAGATGKDGKEADGTLRVKRTGPWTGVTAKRCKAVESLLRKVSARHGVDPGLIAGIAKHESRFKVTAKNPRSSATGLMQVLASTKRRLKCGNMRDAEDNLDCGVRLLAGWLRYYKGNVMLALSGYGLGFAAPNKAKRDATLPRNRRFIERVLRSRATFMRYGCGEP